MCFCVKSCRVPVVDSSTSISNHLFSLLFSVLRQIRVAVRLVRCLLRGLWPHPRPAQPQRPPLAQDAGGGAADKAQLRDTGQAVRVRSQVRWFFFKKKLFYSLNKKLAFCVFPQVGHSREVRGDTASRQVSSAVECILYYLGN